MAADADVLIENYRPDVKHRLGFDYETLHTINPRLVYVSLSGFGQTGPYANRPGFDQIAQGMGGLMSITGLAGPGTGARRHPHRRSVRRQLRGHGRVHRSASSGRSRARASGCRPRCCRRRSPCSTSRRRAGRWQARCRARPATTIRPAYPTGVFPTKDGHINIAASGQHIFTRALQGARRRAPARGSRLRHRREALARTASASMPRSASTRAATAVSSWSRSSMPPACPPGPIYSVDQTFGDPQVQHVGMAVPIAAPHPRTGGGRQPGDGAVAHALRDRPPDARARRAHRRGSGPASATDKDAIADLRSRKGLTPSPARGQAVRSLKRERSSTL